MANHHPSDSGCRSISLEHKKMFEIPFHLMSTLQGYGTLVYQRCTSPIGSQCLHTYNVVDCIGFSRTDWISRLASFHFLGRRYVVCLSHSSCKCPSVLLSFPQLPWAERKERKECYTPHKAIHDRKVDGGDSLSQQVWLGVAGALSSLIRLEHFFLKGCVTK